MSTTSDAGPDARALHDPPRGAPQRGIDSNLPAGASTSAETRGAYAEVRDEVASAEAGEGTAWNPDKLRFQSRCVAEMLRVIRKFLDPNVLGLAYGVTDEDVRVFAETVLTTALAADIERLVKSDPATRVAGKNPNEYVLETYKGVQAILHYRIANALLSKNHLLKLDEDAYRDVLDQEGLTPAVDDSDGYFVAAARRISEEAAILTTIEINPSAQIGKGFVIDHGVNVKVGTEPDGGIVVGETCIIGDDCTLLNGVVLGASEVNTGRVYTSRRHPKLGNGVTICAGARIVGAITIGDSVWVGPSCIITHDVPSDCKVTMITELQYERPRLRESDSKAIRLYGLVPTAHSLRLYGEGLSGATIRLTDRSGHSFPGSSVDTLMSSDECIEFKLDTGTEFSKDLGATLEIAVGKQRLYLVSPPGLLRAVERRNTDGGSSTQ